MPVTIDPRWHHFTEAVFYDLTGLLRWQEWFRRVGMDFTDIAVPGAVFRDTERWRLAVEVYVRNEHGRIDGTRATRLFQLEAPPPPFPG